MKWVIAIVAGMIVLAAIIELGLARTGREIKVGDEAPDFSLPASDGRTWRLSEFRGKQAVVVAWFPKAFTGG